MIIMYLMLLIQVYKIDSFLFFAILVMNIIFFSYFIYSSYKDDKEKDSLKKNLKEKNDQIKLKETEILSLQKELENIHNQIPRNERSQFIVNSWNVRYATTEFKACNINNVSDPIEYPDNLGVYRFDSLTTKGVSYDTTLLSCTCPSFTRTDYLQMRPCKHMIRLAICLGYYSKARYTQNQEMLNSCINEYKSRQLKN